MFKLACGPVNKGGWGNTASEFWNMSTSDWWLMYDAFIGDDIKEQQETTARLRSYFK